MNSRFNLAVITLAAMVLIPDLAFGYLDPGTGSIIVQVLVAGVLGALFTIKNFYRTIKDFIIGIFKGRASKEHKPVQ
jgi:hypothetical protein